VRKLLSDPARAVEVLGAVQNDGIVRRLDARARSGRSSSIPRRSPIRHFPNATIRTPLIVKLSAADRATYLNEWFGPDRVHHRHRVDRPKAWGSHAMRCAVTARSRCRSTRRTTPSSTVRSTWPKTRASRCRSTSRAAVFVNQSAAFSDFHGTGANPAANASLTDAAYVANRFRVVQHRAHV
jgi:hypothetical protein